MPKSKQLRELDRQDVGPGTLVKVNVPEDMRAAKFNGQKGEIVKFQCKENPIPIIELHNGPKLAIELKYLIYPKQESLF